MNAMIDIETLGTKPGCVILSIAVVPFATLVQEQPFYMKIDPRDCARNGLLSDPATVAWWNKQDQEIKSEAMSGTEPLHKTLLSLTAYLMQFGKPNDIRVWGNGASFDVPILEAAYAACNLTPYWKYYNSACYRTLKLLHPEVPFVKPVNAHDALADATAQATHAEKIFKLHHYGDK